MYNLLFSCETSLYTEVYIYNMIAEATKSSVLIWFLGDSVRHSTKNIDIVIITWLSLLFTNLCDLKEITLHLLDSGLVLVKCG